MTALCAEYCMTVLYCAVSTVVLCLVLRDCAEYCMTALSTVLRVLWCCAEYCGAVLSTA